MSDSKLQRVNYFFGQNLGADDFRTEQDYFIAKHRLHNRYLHGWGVVNGLKVTVDKSNAVHVSPGIAIDCAGNELLLCSPQKLAAPSKAGKYYVVVEYRETEVNPVLSVPSKDGSAEPRLNNSRIQEDCRVHIMKVDPAANHTGAGPGTAGCGAMHGVSIAQLDTKLKGWKVMQRGRR